MKLSVFEHSVIKNLTRFWDILTKSSFRKNAVLFYKTRLQILLYRILYFMQFFSSKSKIHCTKHLAYSWNFSRSPFQSFTNSPLSNHFGEVFDPISNTCCIQTICKIIHVVDSIYFYIPIKIRTCFKFSKRIFIRVLNNS